MWDGPRPGPRGGPLLRGQMFEGRQCPVPEFRGRDSMHMVHRPPDRPPMDVRRFERPPDMRPRDMEPLDIRGRDPHRDLFRPGDNGDLGMRRRYEMDMRNNLQGRPDFMNPVRHPLDMGGRDVKPRGMREVDGSFMDMRERERFRGDMPNFNESAMDSRRRHPMDNVGQRDEGFRDFGDRPRLGMKDVDGFAMDTQPRDREMMEFDRRNVPSLNPRTRFESDVDFRNRMRPSEFRDRERSPLRFGENDGLPMDVRGRPDLPTDFAGVNRSKFRSGEGNFREQNFPEQREPLMGFRGREDKPHSEDWQGRDMGGRGPFLPHSKEGPPFQKGRERFNPPRGREGGPGELPDFQGREHPPMDFPPDGQKGYGFHPPGREPIATQNWERSAPPDNHFLGQDSSAFAHKGPLESTLPHMDPPPLNVPNRENDKCWPRDQNLKQDQTLPMSGRPPFLRGINASQGKNMDHRGLDSRSTFNESKDLPSDQGPGGVKQTGGQENFPDNSSVDCRDQDYRDIDYRTGSGHTYEYEPGEPHIIEKAAKDSKPSSPQRFDDSVSQMKDQDYRAATSVKEKVSNTISITGIPKTATMEQILGAFAVRDGVPMQGMKIKSVVPGYSYDTAYVEFLNIEDAVHFMESNQGALKVGTKTALMRYIQPDGESKDPLQSTRNKDTQPLENAISSPAVVKMEPPETANLENHGIKQMPGEFPQEQWQRSSNLTPEAWQQQVDQQLQQQQAESLARTPRHPLHPMDPVFKESKTMIIKNVKPNTMVETILKALEPYAYLDERNVRLIRGKPPGAKCFCFVDMDSHEQVTRLVDVLTKPPPLMIDGVRVYVEVAKPLKNQNYRRDYDKSGTSLLGYPPDMEQYYTQPVQAPLGTPALIQGDPMLSSDRDAAVTSDPHLNTNLAQGMAYTDPTVADGTFQASEPQVSSAAAVLAATGDEAYSYATETPDMSTYLYDATSGFYYDPQTTLYYDPSSRYFYNAQTQQYLYWDAVTKSYVPVAGYTTDTQPPVAQAAAIVAQASGPVATVTDAQTPETSQEVKKTTEGPSEKKEEEEPSTRSEKKEKEKEEKPRSLAAFKIMKDMERWAKIQNRQKESVRVPSPVLKTPSSIEEKKASKAADAAFAIFERKGTVGDDLFKKPLAPPKKEEKSLKRPMGSLGLLAADYGAGSDEEEEDKHEAPRPLASSQPEEKEDRLTDWKKMACLLCRRQFPNKDALVRHQQLSDLHKQNMEIHLKIKRSKKELEALENQEKQLNTRERDRELNTSPEMKRKKYQNSWSSGSREMHMVGERPGLGAETVERKKKEPVVWNHATYKQAVRKAMFARFKELE